MLETGEAQDLGHLRDVAEHVGEVADAHGRVATEAGGAGQAPLQIADDGLARDHELVHQDHPRPHLEPARRGEGGEARRRIGAHLQVVVDHRGLAVEEEPGEGRVALEQVEQVVDEVDQLHPVGLERCVPLAVPVGVGNDRHLTSGISSHPAQDTSPASANRWRQLLVRFVLQFVHVLAANGKPRFLTVL